MHRFRVLKQFYLRRALRILPLFYGILILAFAFEADGMRESGWWHAAYLSNVYFYLRGWCGQLSHFWSLAVEEQFYLCWPFLLIFLPKRFLLPAIVSCIVIAPIFEMLMDSYLWMKCSASILTPSGMDALGIGAFLAYGGRNRLPVKTISWTFLTVGLTGLLLQRFLSLPAPVGRLFEDCMLGWVVHSAALGFSGPVGRLLECRPITYLGKISYGLYIFHNFANSICVSSMWAAGNPRWVLAVYGIPVVRILIFVVVTVGLAALSWHFFEKPLNDLKKKVPLQSPQVRAGFSM